MKENVITLNCKFITPGFIYGVNNEPEIRAASIKGLMRFWWRASYDNSTDIEKMENEEAEIFGGTIKENDKEVKHKAKVQIFADLDKNNSYIDDNINLAKKYEGENNDNKKVKGNSDKVNDNDLLGCKYLFYTIGLKGNKEKRYFDEGTCFNVKFIFKEKNKKYVYEYLRSFNLLQLFGGIGSRSRRGGGNFVVKNIINKSSIAINEIKKKLYTYYWGNEGVLTSYYNEIFKSNKSTNSKIRYSNIISNDCKANLYSFTGKHKHNDIESEKSKVICKDLSKLKDMFYQNNSGIREYESKLNIIGEIYKDVRLHLKGNNKRGSSPLIIKIINNGSEYKILLIKLAGSFAIEEHSCNEKI